MGACDPAPAVRRSTLRDRVDPGPGASFGRRSRVRPPAPRSGAFRGAISVNGSPVEMPIAGRAEHASGERLRLAATFATRTCRRMAERIPAGHVRLPHARRMWPAPGPCPGPGTMRWKDVAIVGEREATLSVREARLARAHRAFRQASEGRAVLAVRIPSPFRSRSPRPTTGSVNGEEIGGGATRGHDPAGRAEKAPLELPFESTTGRSLAAAGIAGLSARIWTPARRDG